MAKNWEKLDWSDENKPNTVYRPTEIEALYNISRDAKIIRLHGKKLEFDQFEQYVFNLDLTIHKEKIPDSDKEKASKDYRKYITDLISKRSGFSLDYVTKILQNIDEKVEMREKLGYKTTTPFIKKIEVK